MVIVTAVPRNMTTTNKMNVILIPSLNAIEDLITSCDRAQCKNAVLFHHVFSVELIDHENHRSRSVVDDAE
jgi:hypothetical protein